MFNKKCNNCDHKIKKDFDFCPYCGKPQKDLQKRWGILGRDDEIARQPLQPADLLGGGFLNKMIGNAIKMVEKEMSKSFQEQEVHPNTNFRLFINGKPINPENIKIKNISSLKKPTLEKESKITKSIQKTFDEKQKKSYSSLEKKTPKTTLRRLANAIVYELEVPKVKSREDISIIKIDKTIEIKAIGKEVAYFKILEVDYPIVDYNLNRGMLTVELEIRD